MYRPQERVFLPLEKGYKIALFPNLSQRAFDAECFAALLEIPSEKDLNCLY
jgi:hypothetical protein